jgi:AcrR family transcriptional regulator
MSAVTDGDWRSRRWEATHRRIYETAMRLFQEHGFDNVSVGQVAAAAGVSAPTFYSHFPSKDHIVMQLPTAEQMTALLAGQPTELPVVDRLRRAIARYLASGGPEERADVLARWKIIASTPALRVRAATFERTTAGLMADALLAGNEQVILTPAEAVVVDAHLAAYTYSLLAWADRDGERRLEDVVDEAFEALGHG